MKCNIRWCGQEDTVMIPVNENIGDGSFRVSICRRCADQLGLKPGDDLPSSKVVEQMVKKGGFDGTNTSKHFNEQ